MTLICSRVFSSGAMDQPIPSRLETRRNLTCRRGCWQWDSGSGEGGGRGTVTERRGYSGNDRDSSLRSE